VKCLRRDIILALLLADIFGCGPSNKIIREGPLPVGEVLRRVRERNEKVRSLKGNGTITIESPEGSNSGFFNARLKKPDSLLVEFKGPFGIHVGTLMLSRGQFVFFNKMENRAVVGTPDGRTLQSMFALRMNFDEVLNAFTGEFPEAGSGDSLAAFSSDNGRYALRYTSGEGAKEYAIDGEAFVVRGYTVADTSGAPTLTAVADRVDDSPPAPVPKFLRVIFPRERRSITIAYSGIELNEPVDCSLTLPDHVEIINR
jgi:outer membrane lipoprotein-sorting protein